MFESSITGNILDDGRTTEITGITAGQLATVLTAYTPLTDTAANTAAIGANSTAAANNAAAIATQAAEHATQMDGKLDSAALGPALAPYALAADLAAAEGLIAANASGITALNTSLTAGLAGKASQSALDALEVVVGAKATPESVDTKLQAFSTTSAVSSAIASSANATQAAVATTYALKSVVDQLALDLAAKQAAPDVDLKIATAALSYATPADVANAVALKTTPADVAQQIATALLPYVQQSALDAAVALRTTPADVAQLIATALLPYVQQSALDAALALRDGRLDGLDADVAALQAAGPFATSADLSASEAALQSAIDAILAQLAALTTGGGSNLANAQAWPGEITWDLLLGTNTLRNLHFNAPLSVALANDNFTLSLSCDSYTTAGADAAIAGAISTALVPYETAAQRDAAIAAALAAYSTTADADAAVAAAIAAALVPYGAAADRDGAIAAALTAYSTTGEMNAAIAAAVGAIDLSGYYTIAEVDAAIAAVALTNAPAWAANPPTWELVKGTTTVRNLHFAGPLTAALRNNDDTLEIDCDAYEKAETYTQAEVNAVVGNAIDALNIAQYQTETDVDTAISDALLPYYTAAQTDAAISAAGGLTQAEGDARYFAENATTASSNIREMVITTQVPRRVRALLAEAPLASEFLFTGGPVLKLTCDCYSKADSDSRYFPVNSSADGGGFYSLMLDTQTPRVMRALAPTYPVTRTPVLGGGTLAVAVDCWSKSDSDARYVSAVDYSPLDARYFTENASTASGDIREMVMDTLIPRRVRALLAEAPLASEFLFTGGPVLKLTCDCYSKAESDGKYLTQATADGRYAEFAVEGEVDALDVRVAALEASPLPDDISCVSLTASSHVRTPRVDAAGDWLEVRAGTAGIHIEDNLGSNWATLTSSQAFFATPLRVDFSLTIDTPSGPELGLYTAAVRARAGDVTLTLEGGSSGLRAEGALEITGITTGTEAVFPTSVATGLLAPSPSTTAYMTIVGGLTGTEVVDQSLSPLLRVEDDETKVFSRVLSVTRSGPAAGTVGAVLKNTASTGVARLQLDANNSTGQADVQVLASGGFQVNAQGQTMSLNNQAGLAPLVIGTNGAVTSNYSFTDLSDARYKTNLRAAEPEELAEAFDGLRAHWYDRTDCPQQDKLGFLAQEVKALGAVGEALTGSATTEDGTELATLDYARLSCVLWGAVKRLQERVEALERKKKR